MWRTDSTLRTEKRQNTSRPHDLLQSTPRCAKESTISSMFYRKNDFFLKISEVINFVLSSYQRQKRQDWVDKHYPGKSNNDAKPTIFDKLRKESRCFGCGEDLHKPGVSCPCKNPVCRNCKTKGHIESVCVKSQTTKHQTYNKSHLQTKRWRRTYVHTTPITPQTPTSTWWAPLGPRPSTHVNIQLQFNYNQHKH